MWTAVTGMLLRIETPQDPMRGQYPGKDVIFIPGRSR